MFTYSHHESKELVTKLGKILTQHSLTFGTAESCTGGMVAALCTDVSGSSSWFLGSIVSYANSVKRDVLHVQDALLQTYGAVSKETVHAMAVGCARVLAVDAVIAVTGVAGPTGGSEEKPVGTVWVGTAIGNDVLCKKYLFSGNRQDVRHKTVQQSLQQLLGQLGQKIGRI